MLYACDGQTLVTGGLHAAKHSYWHVGTELIVLLMGLINIRTSSACVCVYSHSTDACVVNTALTPSTSSPRLAETEGTLTLAELDD